MSEELKVQQICKIDVSICSTLLKNRKSRTYCEKKSKFGIEEQEKIEEKQEPQTPEDNENESDDENENPDQMQIPAFGDDDSVSPIHVRRLKLGDSDGKRNSFSLSAFQSKNDAKEEGRDNEIMQSDFRNPQLVMTPD